MNGTMLWFNSEKRHGFIRTEDGERLLLPAHGLAPGVVFGEKCAGTKVTFERVESTAGPQAAAASIVLTPEFRRARTRRR